MKTYEAPKMELIRFEMQEHITWDTTGGGNADFGGYYSGIMDGVEEW